MSFLIKNNTVAQYYLYIFKYSYGYIHSPRRNRLLVERAGKMAYIAINSKLLNEKCDSQSNSDEEEDVDVDAIDDEKPDELFTHENEECDDDALLGEEHDHLNDSDSVSDEDNFDIQQIMTA